VRSAAAAALALALALPASLGAQVSAPAPALPARLQQSVGTYLESNFEPGDQDLIRMPITWSVGAGSPRTTLLEIEPALGWHFTGGTGDGSGLSYTRVRFYHFYGSGRLTLGPDIEAYVKTESSTLLGLGYDRLMPGVQASLSLPRGWRTVFRVRYEVTEDESPGVTPFARVVLRPAVFLPPIGRWSFWGRGDLQFDVHGKASQYNVEALAAVRPDARRRLTLFVEPRVYVSAAARAKNLWRLRSGLVWSLGDLVLHHAEGS
jgi:hypothetical protein